jgi:hypothetical protein
MPSDQTMQNDANKMPTRCQHDANMMPNGYQMVLMFTLVKFQF